ncbi:ABC transporter substrate-binding protein [Microlunatus elymi]|uniref:ABC transporter substrate-binding protein n=1 Tax=Microlunatus elymi TaxID=2596828 RepID=A0A516Q1K3_9ACTN|nr:ABC transporter substrate-binding protein [Microlunatus elymi]QDP97091.1 ABC transporter substrate-binding protein [Microlunatus elymi]
MSTLAKNPQLTRRALLGVSAGLGAAVSLSGCSFFSTAPDTKQVSNDAGPKGKEAPMLAEQVKSGKLPPVEQRLPKNPAIVKPVEKIGQYGGTWHSAMITEEDAQWLTISIGYDPIIRWTREWSDAAGLEEIMPNVAESFRDRDGGRIFEFKLREGVKWSDGKPLTTEDLRFTYEDVNTYPPMHEGGIYDLWLDSETGKPATFKKVDDLTVQYVFTNPKPGFLNEVAVGQAAMIMPMHYLKQFHAKYNRGVEKLVKQANLNDWMQLWENKTTAWSNVDMPTLNAWVLTKALGDADSVQAVRNPYYWKTDPDGSQLPYIDKISCLVLQDPEVELLKVTNGEFDMQMRNFTTVRNKPVVADGEQKGDYRMFSVTPDGPNAFVIGFNMTLKDKGKAKMYANKDFKVGLSYAINRQKIIDTVYAGQGKPWQCAPLPDSPVYNEEFGTQFTEYSPQKANEYLDKAGYSKKDSDGFRLRDGKKITITVLVDSAMPDHVDGMELIKADWKAVGIDTNISRVSEDLYWQRVQANVAEASTWTAGNFEVRATQGSNHYYVASNPRGSSRWGSTWANWYATDGKSGQEPPGTYKTALELFDKMRHTYDARKATDIGKQIIELAKEQFVYIGICTPADSYGIAKNNFRNVMKTFPGSGGYGAPGPNNPEHYFFES